MRHESIPQIDVITEEDARAFVAHFNSRMRELSSNPNIKGVVSEEYFRDNTFIAIIEYEVSETYAESVADEYSMMGITYYCRNCPYLEDPRDKRVMHCDCRHSITGRTHKNSNACETFYSHLKAGRINPIEDFMR